MEFRKEIRSMESLSPLRQFESGLELVEYRRDPLTGCQSRLNVARAGRVRQAERGEVDLSDVIERTRVGCFFCEENIEQSTPKFPPDFCPQGRIRRGGSLIFPNLFPFAEHHAVATLTREHFLDLDRFTNEMLVDNIMASKEYIVSVHQKDKRAKYPMWVWNHLPPSAASIIHPHVQILVDREPTPELGKLLRKSEEYFAEHGRNYLQDLIEEEKGLGERYIGENASLAIISSYAPRGNREVQLIFKGVGNLADVDEKQAADFATSITKILHCYKRMGVDSFNLVTYSAATGENPPHYWLNARIISRPNFQPFHTADTGFMERFYDVWVIEALPEDVAREMRAHFMP
jgi:galactose-1-phosphate uridylyltransferase